MLSRTILTICLFCSAIAFAGFAGSEPPPVRTQAAVFWSTPAERDVLLQVPDLDIMKVKPGHSFIIVTDHEQLAAIRSLGFETEVLIEDMAAYYAARLGRGENFGDFYTYSEATANLDDLYSLYPAIMTPKTSIGTTYEGRSIWAVKISDNPHLQEDEPAVLVDALHHAREPITVNIAIEFARYLCEGYGIDPVATFLVDEREIWIVPVVNPDGYEYNEATYPSGGGMWRKNRSYNPGSSCWGTDLNRNYPYMWGQGGSSSDPCDYLYMGASAGCEIEVQALMDLCIAEEFVTHDSYHSVVGTVLIPWGYTNDNTPDHDLLFEMAGERAPGGYTWGQPDEEPGLYTCSGTTMDWSYGEQTLKPKTLSFCTEVAGSDFWPQESEIPGLVGENIPSCVYLAQAAGAYVDIRNIQITDYVRGDEQVDPGESADLVETLKNLGATEGMESVELVLRCRDPYVGLVDALSIYGSFAPRETKDNASGPHQLNVDADCPQGRPTELFLDMYSEGSLFMTESVPLTIGTQQVVFFDDFENGTGNWSFTGGTWGLVTSYYSSPAHSITESPSGDYPDLVNTRMRLTNGLDLSAYSDATLTFMTRYEIEAGYDYAYAEMSIDGGDWTQLGARMSGFQTSWVEETRSLADGCGHSDVKIRFRLQSDTYVHEDGWYIDDVSVTGAGSPNTLPSPPALAQPAEGDSVVTEHPTLVVSNSTDPDPGTTLTYGFQVFGDALLTNLIASTTGIAEGTGTTEWTLDTALDDGVYWWRAWADDGTEYGLCPEPVSFLVEVATDVADRGAGAVPAWLSAEPNPFSKGTSIAFSLPGQTRVDVSLFDVHGRLVRQLDSGARDAGEHHVWWDGRDDRGHSVAGGVYFCRLEAQEWQESVKLMLIR